MTSREVTEWTAFLQYRKAVSEGKPNTDKVREQLNQRARASGPAETLYDQPIPDDAFG